MGFKQRERILLIAATLGFLALVGDKIILSPIQSAWQARGLRIAELNKSLYRGRSLIEREEDLKGRWQEMKERALPADPSVAENSILKAIDRWMRESRQGITSLKPRPARNEGEFGKLEFSASGRGSLESISRFLYELEKDPLSLRVEKVEIASRSEDARELTFSLRFSGLLLAKETETSTRSPRRNRNDRSRR